MPPRLNQMSLMSLWPRFQDVGNPIIPNTSFLSRCQADLKLKHSQIHCPKFQPSSPRPTLQPVAPHPHLHLLTLGLECTQEVSSSRRLDLVFMWQIIGTHLENFWQLTSVYLAELI